MSVMQYRGPWSKAVVGLLLAFFSLPTSSATYDPDLQWHTLFTRHFSVHYHDGLRGIAERLGDFAENAHQDLTAYFGWEPRQRVDVVLTDHTDEANGYATVVPFNRIVIHAAPPYALSGLEDYDDWLKLVFVHEYVHVLHLDKAGGLPEGLRRIFGRHLLTFPNVFEPGWLIEGLATYMETDESQGIGRGQSNYFRALMRLEVLDGVKGVGQISQPVSTWPSGTAAYLYGVYFFQFLKEKYGETYIRELVERNSEFPIPFLINRHADRTFDKDFTELWPEFEEYLAADFGPEIERVQEHGEEAGEALTDSDYFTTQPMLGPDGSVYYVRHDFASQSRLMRRLPDGKVKALTEVYGNRFDLHPQAGILLSQVAVHENVNFYYDLYRLPLAGGKPQRLTHQGRYYTAAWSGDGQKIAAARFEGGQSSLDLLRSDGRREAVLWPGAEGRVINSLDWAPNGEGIVASIWHPRDGWDLAWFDVAERQWRLLTQTPAAIESQARFTADGAVVFAADYDGIFNIYRLELDSRRLTRLTRVVGGAFFPSLSADGETLVYSRLHTQGYNIYRKRAAAVEAAGLLPVPARDTLSRGGLPADGGGGYRVVEPYHAPRHLQPSWWLPILFTGNQTIVGVTTSSADPLRWHSYDLTAAFDLQNGVPLGELFYTYDRWYPTVTAGVQRRNLLYYNGTALERIRAEEAVILAATFPWLRVDRAFSLTPAVVAVQDRDVVLEAGVPPALDTIDGLVGVAAGYGSARRFPLAYTLSDGFRSRLIVERSFTEYGDYEGERATLDVTYYTPQYKGNVLMGRVVAAGAASGARPFELGGMPDFSLNNVAATFARKRYILRGYPPAVASGNTLLLATGEWHFPLGIVERGSVVLPAALDRLHGTLFAEAGRAGNRGADPAWLPSVGAELNVNAVAGFRIPMDLKVGAARGLADSGVSEFYLAWQYQF